MMPFWRRRLRVRIAPSPTGPLHVGTARTALFNWLLARKKGGKFIVRIEDTDAERSKPEFEEDILENLKWLGITWDEGPYRQSDRLAKNIYGPYIEKLLKHKKAYFCFCSKEKIEEEKKKAQESGTPYVYSGECFNLTEEDIKACQDQNMPSVIRLRGSQERLEFVDEIRGKISFDTSIIGDIVIARDEKTPLYNFAVVVDDYEMKINYLIRGEDHIANTPKQILIYRALGITKLPKFAHLPLLLNQDKSKMSKRSEATTVREYRENKYIPEAIFNFVALLGWHPKSNKEILSKSELIQMFSIADVQKGGAVFDQVKLDWFNDQYFKKYSDKEALEFLGLDVDEDSLRISKFLREREGGAFSENDFNEVLEFIEKLPTYEADLLVWKNSSASEARDVLQKTIEQINDLNEKRFAGENFENILLSLAEKRSKGAVFWPVRIALSGQKTSPSASELAEILGKKEVVKRINLALEKLKEK